MNQISNHKKIQSHDFEPNQAWVIFHAAIEGGTYFLIDAASTYIFGNMPTDSLAKERITDLFQEAWKIKRQWPEKIIISSSNAALDVFAAEAQRNNIVLEAVPDSCFTAIVAPIKKTIKNYG